MPRSVSKAFNTSFRTGLQIGASNFRLQERERIDIEKEQRKIREKKQLKNQQDKDLQRALGVGEDEIDPLTKQPIRNAGQEPSGSITDGGLVDDGFTPTEQHKGDGSPSVEGSQFDIGSTPVQEEQPFKRRSPLEEAKIRATLTPDNRRIYDDFVKANDPSISDTYFGVKPQVHPDGSGGGLYGFRKDNGKKELITELPDYKFKPIPNGSYIVYGTADLDGETVGIAGRRTRITQLEGKGGVRISDLGVIPRGSKGTDKEKTALEHEIAMADVQNTADALATRKQFYINGDFSKRGGESSREDHRIGYNSAMNELALRTLQLGSPEAEAEGLRIWKQGASMIKGGYLPSDTKVQEGILDDLNITARPQSKFGADMTRETYFDAMRNEILANRSELVEGGWSYKDAQAIIKFLEFKYERYLPVADSKVDGDDFWKSIELDADGNIKK